MSKTLILCDCSGSQTIDKTTLEGLEGLSCSRIHSGLCTTQTADAAKYIENGDAVIACLQERAIFEELADELNVDPPDFVDIRDRAGWSDQGDFSGPKMTALVSDALLDTPMGKAVDIASEGVCLIIGKSDQALKAAQQLCETLSVTVLLDTLDEPPLNRDFDVVLGSLKSATGTLGAFEIRIDAFQQLNPAGRGAMTFSAPQDRAMSHCDIILDLSGGTSLFPAPHKRDGYFRVDPGDPNLVAAAIFEASHMVGTFEKPLYLTYDPHICAHSRAEQTGCTKCLDICPTSAIAPDGDNVIIDAMACAGCGACSALCPSGAITYDAPPTSHLFRRLSNLATTYQQAGGTVPQLLVHDAEHGAQMISLSARFDRGLPANVIPIEIDTITGFGHAEMLAALGSGFTKINILLSPKTESDVVRSEAELANALSGNDQVALIDITDPSDLSETLYTTDTGAAVSDPILAIGGRRDVARLASKALQPDLAEPINLPTGAPYGAVLVDTDACTLCLSCASLCPSGALGDNPDMPQLRFQETACLQCGLCETVCPENAITLQPQMNLDDAAFNQIVLHEEEPFACVECGALFGVKSTIERVVSQLEGKHSMFSTSEAGRMIKMCENCRINAQYNQTDNPFQSRERPKVRTTDDYLKTRKDH